MMSATSSARSHIKAGTTLPLFGPDISSIQGPVWVAWREGTLTRAEELKTLCDWEMPKAREASTTQGNDQVLVKAIQRHLKAARQAATKEALVVCPTAQSAPFSTTPASNTQPGTQVEDIDDATKATVSRAGLLVVELVGLTAAAVAAAAAIRRIKGSSERHSLPVALAALKLPTGAITAFLGLLLMRGQFVPGLSALDTSAQILAWALVFGYAQQLFTRLVDQQGQNVINNVRSSESPQSSPSPA
jgi:hypothetical protein